jgi:hypothetical protein
MLPELAGRALGLHETPRKFMSTSSSRWGSGWGIAALTLAGLATGCATGSELVGGTGGAGGAGTLTGTDETTGETTAATTDGSTGAGDTTATTSSGQTTATTGGSTTGTSTTSAAATTTTAAATTSVAAATTAAGGGGECDGQGLCQDELDPSIGCAACAFDGPCNLEYLLCTSDFECFFYSDCISFCDPNDSICFSDCEFFYPIGALEYLSLLSCVICDACYDDCGGAQACQ